MFIGKKTKQRMAVWVVCTLSAGGSLYMGAQTAHAADVTGQNVVVNTAPGASPFAPIRLDPPTTGNVHNNKLTIDGITWAGQIFGALNMTATGSATDNELVLQGNAAITGIVTGGYTAGTGTATGNTITLSGLNGMALTHLYGGFSTGGSDDVTGNTLRVTARNNSAASLNKFEKMNFVLGTGIHSGDTMLQVQNNSTQSFDWSKVTVENGATWAASAPGSQRVRLFEGGNALTLQNYAVSGQTSGDYEYGLTTDASGTGTVTATNIYFDSNRFHKANITVNSAPVGTMSLYGGRSIFGNAVTENTLTVNGVTWTGHVYGGVSESTTMKATGNEVILKGGSDIIGTVTGGFTTGSGVATGNTVTLSGLNGAGHTHLYGGHSASGDDTTGNTLKVTTSGNTAASINSFEKMNFVLGAGIHSGDTMLTVDTSSAQTLKWENIKADKMQAWTTALAAAGINNPMLTLYTGAALTLQNYAPTITRVGDYELRRRANVTSTGTVTATTMSMDGNRYQNATTPTVVGTTVHAGLSNYGSTTNHNTLTIGGGSYTEARAGYTNAAKGGARENTLTFTGGSITNGYGGYTTGVTASDAELAVKPAAKADAAGNIVNLSGGTVNTGGKVYGGYIAVNTGIPAPNNVSDGDASGNTVSITSGIFGANTEIYGGYTNGRGKAVSNTVNLGSAAGVFAAPTLSNTKIYGGGSSGHAHDAVTNNTLNINAANINVRGIANFDKIRANLKSTMPLGSTLLTIAGGATTGLDWAGVEANTGSLSLTPSTYNDRLFTLMHNNAGLNFVQGGKDTYAPIGAKERVQGDLEFVIDTDSHAAQARSVYLSGYQFQNNTGAAYTAADGTHSAAWGGRTAVGNTVTNNKLTVSGGSLTDAAYGGLVENHKRNASGALPTGDAVKNTVILSSGANAASVYGADVRTRAGSASENRAEISGGTVTGNVYGAALSADNASGSATQNIAKVSGGSIGGNVYGASVPKTSGTADVTQNTAEISGGSIGGSVYGGQNVGTGNADQNNVKLSGGSIAGSVYGGYAAGTGSAKDNSITITGGSIGHDIYGGYAAGGKTTGNTVNIGDGSHALSAGTSIAGTIYGGNGADVKDNTLNVKTNATAGNIAGFAKIKFELNGSLNSAQPMLRLTNGAATTGLDWAGVEAAPMPSHVTVKTYEPYQLTLMHNNAGLNFVQGGKDTYAPIGAKERVQGDLEFVIDTDSHAAQARSVYLSGYQFQNNTGAAYTAADGTHSAAWGGRTAVGNTVTNNKLTVSGGSLTDAAYGGLVENHKRNASGALPTGDAVKNTVILSSGANAASVYGADVRTRAGSASENRAEISGGTVTGNVYGAALSADNASGSATQNIAKVSGGSIGGNVYGASVPKTSGTADVTQNTAEISGGSIGGSVYGGQNVGTGNADQNNVKLSGGSIAGSVYGGYAAGTGSAKDNSITITGGSIGHDIYGGYAAGGKTTGNTVNIGDGSHALSAGTSIAGTIYGGNGADVKDNTLNINAKGASAGSIAGFGSITYRLNGLLNGDTLLTLRQNTSIAYGTIQKLTAQNAAAWLGNDMERKVSLFAMTGGKTLTLGGYTTGSGMERTGDLEYGLRTDNDRSATTGTLDIAAYRWQNADVTVRTAMPEAFGGKSVYRTNGETKNNKLTLASGAVLTSAVAGDTQTEQGAATGSVLTVRSGARVTGTAIGAKARGGAVQKSSAVAEGGTIAQLIGGQSASGIADTNTAELRGGTVGSMIGGESQTGAAKGNAAAVRGGSVTSAAGGKAGAASEGNSVLMQGGTAANLVGGIGASSAKDGVRVRGGSVTSSIIGGTAAHGNAVQSTAVIEGGTVRGTVLGASASGKAEQNAVTLTGGDIRADIIGARAGGDAEANTITVNTNITGNVAGAAAGAKALKNVIDLGNITVRGNVTGGQGNVTNDNIIHLRKSTVTGVITGGTAASGTGNTLVVHPGASQMSSFTGVQNLHFYLDQTVDKTAPILSLTGSSQDLRGVKIGVGVIDGKIPALRVNDQLSLIKMAAGGTLMTDAAIKNTTTGMQGVSLHYDFSITRSTPGELTATVTKAALGEQTKSFVETRAGMSDFINHGADSLASGSMNAAQKEAAKSGGYALWAATDKSNMKAKTGSYIDTNGWSLGLGWARTQRAKAGAWTFGPFVEYGHGSYGSYLNDGTHGSGKISYIGGGLMAKYAQHSGLWVEGSVHGGRAKSDYTGSIYKGTVSSYDGSSSYYAAHLGLGKELRIRRGDQLDAYLRYFYSHQAGMNATLSSGEDYTFDSVNSHRLRLGLRYTHRDSPASHVYAGLAFEYEFDGEARASFQGYSTPSPSLKGASGMLEIGYRFAPKGAKVSYDFNMTGWQGRREGVSGSANVKWMF